MKYTYEAPKAELIEFEVNADLMNGTSSPGTGTDIENGDEWFG